LLPATAEIGADIGHNIVEYHVIDAAKRQQTWAISDFDTVIYRITFHRRLVH